MMKNRWWSLSFLNSRFPALHGLRVVAIFLVVQLHVTDAITHEMLRIQPGTVPKIWGAILSFNCWFAMDLFFIMSGFLIGHILIYSFTKTEHGTFRRFYFRRSFRTFPLYYFFLFGFFFLNKIYAVELPISRFGFTHITYNEILYLTNYPFEPWRYLVYWSWSLSLEEHFYLLAPIFIFLLMKLKTHRARLIALGAVWASAFFVRLGIFEWGLHTDPVGFIPMRFLYTPTHARYDILIAGIFIAYLDFYFAEQVKEWLKKSWVRTTLLTIAISGFALMLSPEINPTPLGLVDPDHKDLILTTGRFGIFYFGTLTSLVYICVIIPCLYADNRLTRWLGHHHFLRIATLGYGVYLVHMPVIYQMSALANWIVPSLRGTFYLQWAVLTPLAITVSIVLSYALHLIVEKPCLYLRDKLVP